VSLQNGTPLEDLRSCATYRSDGTPSTVVGVMLDRMTELES